MPASDFSAVAQLKQLALKLRDASALGPISADTLIDFVKLLRRVQSALLVERAAREQVISEINAVLGNVESTRTWITTNFPRDPADWLQIYKLDADGQTSARRFGSSQLAPLRTLLDQLANSIT